MTPTQPGSKGHAKRTAWRSARRTVNRRVAQTSAKRRSPQDLIWGWGSNGDRHPGILERLGSLESGFFRLSRDHKSSKRLMWILLGSVWLDMAAGHLPSLHTLPFIGGLVP